MSPRIGIHLALALVWCALWGSFSAWNLLAGLLVGLGVLAAYSHAVDEKNYAKRLFNLVRFGVWFFVLLMRSNVQIAAEILTSGWTQTPRILKYSVEGLSDVEITVLANSITLTPGTLAMDVSDDGRYLYLHCMYAEDREAQLREIDTLRERLERWVFS
ncbi:MAG: Na+/H+ antiporter subunit E [Phycisphaerales bacterium]